MTVPPGLTQPPDSQISSTPSGTTSPGVPAATEPYRFGSDVPEWMQGKTGAEVGRIGAYLAQLATQAVTQPQPAPVQQQPPPQALAMPAADEWVTGAQLQNIGQQYLQQMGQAVAPAYEMAASANLDAVKRDYKDAFAKYGPEIYGRLAHLPKTGWTVDNLSTVVKLSLVDHVDELADARAAQLAATRTDPALRASGAPGNIPSQQPSPEDRLTDDQKAVLRRQGLTPQLIAEHAGKFGIPVEKWYERFAKTSVGDAV